MHPPPGRGPNFSSRHLCLGEAERAAHRNRLIAICSYLFLFLRQRWEPVLDQANGQRQLIRWTSLCVSWQPVICCEKTLAPISSCGRPSWRPKGGGRVAGAAGAAGAWQPTQPVVTQVGDQQAGWASAPRRLHDLNAGSSPASDSASAASRVDTRCRRCAAEDGGGAGGAGSRFSNQCASGCVSKNDTAPHDSSRIRQRASGTRGHAMCVHNTLCVAA